jgi:hypothetical protein
MLAAYCFASSSAFLFVLHTNWMDRALVKPQCLWIVLAMWVLVRVMADFLFCLKKLALSHYFVNANLHKSKKMRVQTLWNGLPCPHYVFQADEV